MKYMGSKAKLAKSIYNRICEITPRNHRPWVEPFAGGMNMMCNVPPQDGPRYAADANPYLIAMFSAMVNGWIPPKTITKEFYYKCKELKDEEMHVIGYVGFNGSYCGRWFSAYAGSVKTKTGIIRNYQEEAFRHMQKQIKKLNDVKFYHSSYDELEIENNSIVYCDPPYYGTIQHYGSSKGKFNHDDFWNWVRTLSHRCDVFVSEYSAPDDFECVWSSDYSSSLSANGKSGSSKITKEKLFRFIK